jgi:hypothetical protein
MERKKRKYTRRAKPMFIDTKDITDTDKSFTVPVHEQNEEILASHVLRLAKPWETRKMLLQNLLF